MTGRPPSAAARLGRSVASRSIGATLINAPTADQVRALAPDASAARAGDGLASGRHWQGLGRSERAVWGLCQGSGASPYQVSVDLAGPAFKCSCPSRKFPCKHGLGILLLLASDPLLFAAGEVPAFTTEWLASRETRAAAAEERATRPPAEVDEAARAKRVEARNRKVAAGLDDFDRWLRDLLRRGLVGARSEGYGYWDAAGARLVDAQAASLGRSVRGFGAIANSGAAWGDRALEHAARLHLLVEGYRRLDDLPDGLRHDVRSLVGWTVKEEDLPADGAVTDRWLALGRTLDVDDRIATARTWLLGETTGRWALHLAFSPAGPPPPIVLAGGSLQGSMVPYPSAMPLRAALRDGSSAGAPVTTAPPGVSIAAAIAAFADVLAADPFVDVWPVVLAPVVPVVADGRLVVRDATDDDGLTVPVTPAGLTARLMATAGGHPLTVVGLWSGRSLQVLSAVADGRFVDMATDTAGPGAGELAITSGGDADRPGPSSGGDRAWERLVGAALLGTERLGDDRDEAVSAHPLGSALAVRDPETRLLSAAAVVALRRRAGWRPPPAVAPLPAAAKVDPRPIVGRAAAAQLGRILDERRELLGEWLELAAPTGRRPPDETWPRLLGAASRDASIRRDLAPLVGPRARWLVERLPDYASGLATAGPAAGDAGAPGAGPGQDPTLAFEGAPDSAARAEVIAALRATDPAAGRSLVEGAWEAAAAEERALLVGALATGRSLVDEPLLERARADRRADVRAAAAVLLARLPGSAFADLAETTARPLLALAGRLRPSLEVALPVWDDRLERLVIARKPPQGTGERAWWLRQLMARVDPGRWATWLAAEPADIISRALRVDEAKPLIEGWVEAAVRFEDARWAAALLAEDRIVDRSLPDVDPLRLLGVLPAAARDASVIAMLRTVDADQGARLVAACPRPWSSELSRASLGALGKAASTEYPPQGFYDHVRIAARRMPPALADELEAVVMGDERRRRSEPLRIALDTIHARQQLTTAFKEDR